MATTTDWCAAEAGLDTSVKIRLATRNADGMKGCFESHVAAIAQGLKDTPQHCSKDNTQKQARFILVCEDDIEFKHRRGMTLEQALNTARRALASKQCEVVGIGGWAIRSFRDEIVPKCRLVKWNCAHCYLVSREAAEKIKGVEVRAAQNKVGLWSRQPLGPGHGKSATPGNDCAVACLPARFWRVQ